MARVSSILLGSGTVLSTRIDATPSASSTRRAVVSRHQSTDSSRYLQSAFGVKKPSTSTSPPVAPPQDKDAPINEIAFHVHRNGGRLPLSKIIHSVTTNTKVAIFKSGKGLEGFVRSCPGLSIETGGSEKVVVIRDASLAAKAAAMQAPADRGPRVVVVSDESVGGGPKASAPPKLVFAAPPAAVATLMPEPVPAVPKRLPAAQPSAEADSAVPTVSTQDNVVPSAVDPPEPLTPATVVESGTPTVGLNTKTEQAILPNVTEPTTPAAPTQADDDVEKKKDPNYVLRQRIIALCPTPDTYYSLNEIFSLVYRGATDVKYTDLLAYATASEKYFWLTKGCICLRRPDHVTAPPFVTGTVSKPKPATPQTPKAADPKGSATSSDFGGWGAAPNVPTTEDIYEMLKFVPMHWVSIGDINVPKEVRKKHVRISSIVLWFERQPRYFEVRMVSGTLEVRRSIVLHPDAHKLTKQQAEDLLAKKMAEMATKGSVIQQLQEFTASRERGKAEAIVSATRAVPGMTEQVSALSAAMDAVIKLVLRVTPGYPVPIAQILRRSSKKSITAEDIIASLPYIETQIERIDVQTTAGEKTILIRKKTGVDAATWGAAFQADISGASSLKSLCTMMTLTCCQWDRTHFLYVRLSDDEKRAVGGFDGMITMLKAHPAVFKVGEYFVKRQNPSDPSSETDVEPTSNTQSSTVQLEENPYHVVADLALIFHYLTPDDQMVSLSHFVESSSPAMRAVLPPRLVSVIQAHPELFVCREVSPGKYSIAKAKQESTAGGSQVQLSREEVIKEVMSCVPVRGIDIGHLHNALTPALRQAVTGCFGASGLNGLVASAPNSFHVIHNPPYTTIFLKN